MGILVSEEIRKKELDEFRRILLSCAAVQRRKDDDGFVGLKKALPVSDRDCRGSLVCVTSGVSCLGIAIVNQLFSRGYSVRIIVDKEEDVEKLRELIVSGEMRFTNTTFEVVIAKLTDFDSIVEAFDGCFTVFHTASFTDPAGLSGYTKAMADIEVTACVNVVKACGVSPSTVNCVLTSSLLTCIWQDDTVEGTPHLIDHKCWSDESVCINKKLWYALGKLRAEKAAWEIAKENSSLNLATICSGLISGQDFYHRNPTSTIAYLKGVNEMYARGLLATVDLDRLAKAHIRVFEEVKKASSGRYICFDRVIEGADEIEKLAHETGLNAGVVTATATGVASSSSSRPRFELSNARLARLMFDLGGSEAGKVERYVDFPFLHPEAKNNKSKIYKSESSKRSGKFKRVYYVLRQ